MVEDFPGKSLSLCPVGIGSLPKGAVQEVQVSKQRNLSMFSPKSLKQSQKLLFYKDKSNFHHCMKMEGHILVGRWLIYCR